MSGGRLNCKIVKLKNKLYIVHCQIVNEVMEIKLKRYYGDESVTKSVMEVWMEGEEEPRLVCEAREVEDVASRGMKDGEEVFRELDELLYEAFGKGEEMWVIIEN